MGNEAIAVVGVIFVGWVGWISITTIQNNIKINSLMSIKTLIESMNSRLDIFIKNELDTLKDITERK